MIMNQPQPSRRRSLRRLGNINSPVRYIFLLLLLLLLTTTTTSYSLVLEKANADMNVLLVGNSYTSWQGGLDTLLKGLFVASHEASAASSTPNEEGDDTSSSTTPGVINIKRYTKNGRRLAQHFEDAQRVGNTLKQWLQGTTVTDEATGTEVNEPPTILWNYVILQEQSQTSGFEHTTFDYMYQQSYKAALGFGELIKENLPGCRPVFFMTWGRRGGDSGNGGIYPDFLTMNAKLRAGYEKYADAITGGLVAPVGLAFERVYKGELDAGTDPLSTGSLFYQLYSDGSHPSKLGSYLTACVFYATITMNGNDDAGHADLRGLTYKPNGMSDEMKNKLQQTAYWTVWSYYNDKKQQQHTNDDNQSTSTSNNNIAGGGGSSNSGNAAEVATVSGNLGTTTTTTTGNNGNARPTTTSNSGAAGSSNGVLDDGSVRPSATFTSSSSGRSSYRGAMYHNVSSYYHYYCYVELVLLLSIPLILCMVTY